MKIALFLVAMFVVFPHPASAQATISGYAISLDTGKPIGGVEVVLKDRIGLEIEKRTPVLTAANGSFKIGDLEPGSYILHASVPIQADGDVQVLVSARFELTEEGQEIHFGFSKRATEISHELLAAIREANPTEERYPRDSAGFDSGGMKSLLARAHLLRPTIKAIDGRDLLNAAYRAKPNSSR